MVPRLEIDSQVHDAYIGALALVASVLPKAASARLGAWFLYDAGVDNPEFNVAAVAGDPLRACGELPRVEHWFARRGVGWRFKLRPEADASTVSTLGSRVIEAGRREPFMWRSLAGLDAGAVPGLTIERVADERALAAYDWFDRTSGRPPEWSVAAAVMPLPACSLWLGWHGDEPVARAMAVAGTVGMIHNVVVAEPFRRRGYGRAITAAAAGACATAGADSVCLGASRMGYPLYLEMGFEHRYDLATVIPVPARQNAAAPPDPAKTAPSP